MIFNISNLPSHKGSGYYPNLKAPLRYKEEVFKEAVQITLGIEDEALRADILTGMTFLAEVEYTREIIKKYIRRELLMMSELWKEWSAEERKEALEKGEKNSLVIKTLHGITIDELIKLEESYHKKSIKSLIRTVIMRYQGIHPREIQDILGKSRPTITGYINKWNEHSLDALVNNHGGSVSTFTDEMLEDLKDTVLHKSPKDYGFLSSTWDTHMLSGYIGDTFGKEYSSEWIRQILIKLGFSYKRGQYIPTKGDPELQEAFKKGC